MKYIISQDWKNTKGNHAGMTHLGKLIYYKNPKDYKLIIVPDIIFWFSNKTLISIQCKIQPFIYNIIYIFISLYLIFKIKKGDYIFLFEYLLKEKNQFFVVRILKLFFDNKITVYGLIHLTPLRIEKTYTKKDIIKYSSYLDYILTLGSSLSDYFISNGINKNKIITTFHYVDTKYYLPNESKSLIKTEKLSVIIMGMQMRDFTFLIEIIKNSPNTNFILCSGLLKLNYYFEECSNIIIKGFMPESELKEEMNKADISLNIMLDTVGSNVITTSMAMALVNIVTNVGSIKDYCTNSNSFFCDSLEDFLNAINTLNNNRELLLSMKYNSLQHSKQFQFENFYTFLNKL
jgi:hypothetical protein